MTFPITSTLPTTLTFPTVAPVGFLPASMHAADLDHRLYLLAAVATHAAVGYALAEALAGGRPLAGALGGVLPDVDLLFSPAWEYPFVHRGATHTLAFVMLVVAATAALDRDARTSSSAVAVSAGLVSHLALDSLSPAGIAWLYPLADARVALGAPVHALPVDVALVVVAIAVVLAVRRRR